MVEIFGQALQVDYNATTRIKDLVFQLVKGIIGYSFVTHTFTAKPELVNDLQSICQQHFQQKSKKDGTIYYIPKKVQNPSLFPQFPNASSSDNIISSTSAPTIPSPFTVPHQRPISFSAAPRSPPRAAEINGTFYLSTKESNLFLVAPFHEEEKKKAVIQRLHEKKVAVPEQYLCPLTKSLMFDPVSAADGHTYLNYLFVSAFFLIVIAMKDQQF